MAYYPNIDMDICSYTDTEELDAYGNPVKAYVYRETIPVDFQPSNRGDRLTEAGEILQDTYRLFIDESVEVDPTDIFRDPSGDTYTIIGSPIVNNRFKVSSHKRVDVQKTNKPIDVLVEEYYGSDSNG